MACDPRVLSAAARRQLAGGSRGQKARFNKININCRAAARSLNIQARARPPKKPFIGPVLRRGPRFLPLLPGRWWSLSLSLRGGRRSTLTPTSRFGARPRDVGKNSTRIKDGGKKGEEQRANPITRGRFRYACTIVSGNEGGENLRNSKIETDPSSVGFLPRQGLINEAAQPTRIG